jgi:hypothetical protein
MTACLLQACVMLTLALHLSIDGLNRTGAATAAAGNSPAVGAGPQHLASTAA